MSRESLFLGVGTALIGLVGLLRQQWLLAETPKGRMLVESLGLARARLFHGVLCLGLLAFGVLLAAGFLAPWRW